MVHHCNTVWNTTIGHGLKGTIMRCLSCNCNLSDREATRKFEDWEQIKNPEARYVSLCDDCLLDTDIGFIENPDLHNEAPSEDVEVIFQPSDETFWTER